MALVISLLNLKNLAVREESAANTYNNYRVFTVNGRPNTLDNIYTSADSKPYGKSTLTINGKDIDGYLIVSLTPSSNNLEWVTSENVVASVRQIPFKAKPDQELIGIPLYYQEFRIKDLIIPAKISFTLKNIDPDVSNDSVYDLTLDIK